MGPEHRGRRPTPLNGGVRADGTRGLPIGSRVDAAIVLPVGWDMRPARPPWTRPGATVTVAAGEAEREGSEGLVANTDESRNTEPSDADPANPDATATDEELEDLGVTDDETAETVQGGHRRLDQDMDPY